MSLFRNPPVQIVSATVMVMVPFLLAQRLVPLLPLGGSAASLVKAVTCILACFGAYLAYVRLIEQRSATELSLRAAPRELAGGVVLGAFLLVATIGILAALGIYRATGTGPWTAVIVPLAVALVIATFEEIVFRGILFRLVEKSLGTWLALLISASIFGALHSMGPHATLLGSASIVVGASVLLTGAYKLTGRLWFPIGVHAAWNFTQGGIFGAVVSGHPGEGLVRGTLTGPSWLSGASFGPEGSVVAIALCLLAGLSLFLLAVRDHRIVAPYWRRMQPLPLPLERAPA